MASESPDVDEMSNQEETQPNDPSDNNFQDEEIDPNAPTQYIEDDKSNENQESMDASEMPTQIMGSPESLNQANSYSQDVDLEAPTQMLPQSHDEEASMNDGDDVDTQAQTQITTDSGLLNTQSEQENIDADDSAAPTQLIQESSQSPRRSVSRSASAESEKRMSNAGSRSRSRSPQSRSGSPDQVRKSSRSRSRSPKSRESSRARSRSRSGNSASRSRSRSVVSRSRSQSVLSRGSQKSRSRSRSRSRSVSRSVSRSRSRSVSRSRSRSKSHSISKSRSRSRSRSVRSDRSRASGASRSRSRSRSRSGERNEENEEVVRTKKRVVKEAFGSGSDSEGSDKEGKEHDSPKKRKRSGSRRSSDSEDDSNERNDDKPVSEENGDDQPQDPNPENIEKTPDSSDDEGPRNDGGGGGNECDFDMMLERKKAENRRRRRKKDIDLINDNDDAIAKMIADMRLAAREDRELNQARQPATKKISMLPIVMTQLNKADLQMAFVEANVLSVLTDWLAPMPDKSLPTLEIRKQVLHLLVMLRIDDHSRLKESGIGKAVMYLYKHPKELRENKDKAGRIINNWARPIFNLSTDFQSIDKAERLARDDVLRVKKSKKKKKTSDQHEETVQKGKPGYCNRARVPRPTTTAYINRPEWTSDVDMSRIQKKEATRLDRYIRAEARKKIERKERRAVKISIEGTKMGL